MHSVAFRETGQRAGAVLMEPTNQVRRYADINCAIRLAGKNIDARLFLLSHGHGIADQWMLKQVQHDELGGAAI